MNTANRKTFISVITLALIVSSVVTLTQTSVQAGWFKNAVDSVKKEVKNCTSGGCDPTRPNPNAASDALKTATGARAIGAATNRWFNRQVRVQGAKVNSLKQKLIDEINENAQCTELLPEMQGVCSELNSSYGLNIAIKQISRESLFASYNGRTLDYLIKCINTQGIVFERPQTFSCLNLSNYTE